MPVHPVWCWRSDSRRPRPDVSSPTENILVSRYCQGRTHAMTTARPEVSGSFYRYPLPKLLFYLYGKQFTGVLAVREGITERFLYLREGVPLHANVSDDVASIRTLCRQFGWADDLDARKQQLIEKITCLFRLPDAEFSIYRSDHEYGQSPEQAKRLRVHPRRAIHHGIRGGYDRDRVRAEIGT